MGLTFSCVKCVDVSDNLHRKEEGKRKAKTNKTCSSQDQPSHHVTSTSVAEVLIAEEPGHAEVDDEWSDAAFQALVGDSSEWGADVLNSLSCVWSVGVLQDTVCATSEDSVPVQDVAYYRANVPRVPVRDVADCSVDVPQVQVSTTSAPGLEMAGCCFDLPEVQAQDVADCSVDVPQVQVSTTLAPGLEMADCCFVLPPVPASPWTTSDCIVNVPHVGPTSQLKQLEDKEIINTGFYSYEIVRKLGEGGFGSVYAGIRLQDGLEVALKFADNVGIEDWINIEDYHEPVPKEIGLLILANKGVRVPQIIQLIDWVVEPQRYVMVLECPKPCEDLTQFLERHNWIIKENMAKIIMSQATLASYICCLRGVFHRDIKLENLLINPDSREVKLIDFGCGEILTDAGYTSFAGTKEYFPPEYDFKGEYHGEPATVWSLGILMFTLLCGQFPEPEDLDDLNDNNWAKDGLSQECCDLLCALLQTNPETRLELENVSFHNWFE